MVSPNGTHADRFAGRTAVITGAARGQGRSHALRLAAEGADVIAVDVCRNIETVAYDLATPAELDDTVAMVRDAGRRAVGVQADVRNPDQLTGGIENACAELGTDPDVVVANAGIGLMADPDDRAAFRDQLDVNLAGVWNTVQATAHRMIAHGRGGAIVLISSVYGLTGRGGDGRPGTDGYVASKHGVIGLTRSAASWLAPHRIRVNCVNPTGVATPMVLNPAVAALAVTDEAGNNSYAANVMDVPMLEPEDLTAAVTFLASDEARYITGISLPVDAGLLLH
ncbi:dehydrogenase of unknown specificity, short-chain alcohol dehydrogenase like [Prauserella sp. Am3]|nr:dehydrogenase of unknown specificity, short-chain alcohol dehydrogenase like [Prauserella sp. Am3]